MTKRSAEHPQVNVSDHQIFKVGSFMSNCGTSELHRSLLSVVIDAENKSNPSTNHLKGLVENKLFA